MIYIIKSKPYVKVANYYKEISISKNGKEYIAEPVGGPETRIENVNPNEISEVTVAQYMAGKKTQKNEMQDID